MVDVDVFLLVLCCCLCDDGGQVGVVGVQIEIQMEIDIYIEFVCNVEDGGDVVCGIWICIGVFFYYICVVLQCVVQYVYGLGFLCQFFLCKGVKLDVDGEVVIFVQVQQCVQCVKVDVWVYFDEVVYQCGVMQDGVFYQLCSVCIDVLCCEIGFGVGGLGNCFG